MTNNERLTAGLIASRAKMEGWSIPEIEKLIQSYANQQSITVGKVEYSKGYHVGWKEAEAAQQWQPMETAPKDYDGCLIAHGYDGDTGGPCSVDQARWCRVRNLWWQHRLQCYIADPQGWMPLPAPPTEAVERVEVPTVIITEGPKPWSDCGDDPDCPKCAEQEGGE